MRLGSCRASLTRPAAPTSEKSDLLKLCLSHRENGCGNRVWLQISNRRMCIAWPERKQQVLVVDCRMHFFEPNRRF